jgi:hypothetical protein
MMLVRIRASRRFVSAANSIRITRIFELGLCFALSPPFAVILSSRLRLRLLRRLR